MRLEHLQYILTIAETGSISTAAEQLFISQQGISDALRRIEKDWGIELFHRTKTGVTLSTNGKRLLPYIKAIVDDQRILEKQIADISTECINCNHISLLGNALVISGIAPELSKQLMLLDSNITLQYQEADTPVMISELLQQHANAAILRCQSNEMDDFLNNLPPELILYQLFRDEIYISIPYTHPLAKRKFITEQECKSYSVTKYNSFMQLDLSNSGIFDAIFAGNKMVYTSKVLAKRFFPQKEIISLPLVPEQPFSHCLLLHKDVRFENDITFIQALHDACYIISKQYSDLADLIKSTHQIK